MASTLAEKVEIEVGPIDAVSLALYAAASGDHNPLHLDAEVARRAGFEGPIAQGMLTMAYVGRMLSAHFGVGRLRSLSIRFSGVVLLGDRLAISGILESKNEPVATYRLRATNQNSRNVLSGIAVISLDRQ